MIYQRYLLPKLKPVLNNTLPLLIHQKNEPKNVKYQKNKQKNTSSKKKFWLNTVKSIQNSQIKEGFKYQLINEFDQDILTGRDFIIIEAQKFKNAQTLLCKHIKESNIQTTIPSDRRQNINKNKKKNNRQRKNTQTLNIKQQKTNVRGLFLTKKNKKGLNITIKNKSLK